MEGYKLKKGDLVVMHTCMEHDHPDNFGKIWTCRSDEFQHKGHDYGSIFLDGFSGSFSTEFLQKVKIEPLLIDKDATIASLQTELQKSNECAAHYTCKHLAEENRYNMQNKELADKDETIKRLEASVSFKTVEHAQKIMISATSNNERLRKALEEARQYPRQPNNEGGWTLKYDFLEKIADMTYQECEEYCSMEQVEGALLCAERLLGEGDKHE
ncbi:hypothetical protein RE628_11335 [Paenibacillus sp. D2_2]|uniref:hypothetical protein n=1 Tax=Paenibacillus sp. D2_2 TaxID=3073092 RepID=UPI0028161F67|nr:hypothetical protein [Paenibacillus sp. D2_2]WMT42820.1 hypothetical protein RE628_11335 [Paenibacillus sp. D2_2]